MIALSIITVDYRLENPEPARADEQRDGWRCREERNDGMLCGYLLYAAPGLLYGTLLRLELCINIGMSLPWETVTQYEVVGI